MSLKYILDRVRSAAGMNSTDLNLAQRALLLDYVNEAAKEIYESIDLPNVLKEAYIQVNNEEKTLALPPFVGILRACRDTRNYLNEHSRWSLVDTRPRYVRQDWDTKWNKVRILGDQPLANEIESETKLTFTMEAADASLIITIVGETESSNRAIETITMDATTKTGTKVFTNITSIKKSKVTDYNILVTDESANELAVIYADRLESNYRIVDISEYPQPVTCENNIFVMEILYKPALNRMELDADEFPLPNCDDMIVLKTKQLLQEERNDEVSMAKAVLMDKKVERKIKQKIGDESGNTQKKLISSRNPYYDVFRRGRYYKY